MQLEDDPSVWKRVAVPVKSRPLFGDELVSKFACRGVWAQLEELNLKGGDSFRLLFHRLQGLSEDGHLARDDHFMVALIPTIDRAESFADLPESLKKTM